MQTYRNKFYILCDEEVIADNEQHAKIIGQKQLEQKLYNTDINFVKIEAQKAVDADMARKVKRI